MLQSRIFYGNPLDFFQKDKARLEFKDFFKSNYQPQLEQYTEIVARRNIIVHNGGKVDRKYLREVNGATAKLGSVVYLSSDYLRESIVIMEGLGAVATKLILERIYGHKPSAQIQQSCSQFDQYAIQKSEAAKSS
jgi:hypothetical protein